MSSKFSKEIPKIYYKLHDKFGVEWDDGVIIPWNDKIHCKFDLPEEKIVHEEVHLWQQRLKGPKAWFDKYISDPVFRLNQEVEACRAEVKWIESNVPDRNKRFKMIHAIATLLSGSVYGDLVSYQTAMELINK
jgi:hypothetical protein